MATGTTTVWCEGECGGSATATALGRTTQVARTAPSIPPKPLKPAAPSSSDTAPLSHTGRLAATWLSEFSIQTGDVQGTRITLGLVTGDVELLRAVLP